MKMYKIFNISNKAFTLVELLVVLMIISILMAVAVPIFLGTRNHAQDNAAKQILANASRAAIAYYVQGESFPPRANDSDAGTGETMSSIEGAYQYVLENDGEGAPIYNSNPPRVAYDPTNGELRTTSQTGDVWVAGIGSGIITPPVIEVP